MGGVEGVPDATQRGHAAQIRQMDDNSGRTMLDGNERRFVNSVIHGESLNHSPRFDEGLQNLTERHTPNNPYTPPRPGL